MATMRVNQQVDRKATAAFVAVCLLIAVAATFIGPERMAVAGTEVAYTGIPGDPVEAEVQLAAEVADVTEEQSYLNFSLNRAVALMDEAARRDYPDTYGGLWRENGDARPVHLAFQANADASAAAVVASSNFPRPDLVSAMEVSRSLFELEQLKAEVTTAFDSQVLPPVLSSMWVDPAANKVRVGVTTLTSGLTDSAALLFGDTVYLEQEASFHFAGSCSSRKSCTPNEFRGTMELIGVIG